MPSWNLIREYDALKRELDLIEEYFDVLDGVEDRQHLLNRYTFLLQRKLDVESAFKELKKWGTFKCVA